VVFAHASQIRSNYVRFGKWFEIECRRIEGFDEGTVTIKDFLKDAYAGISPPLSPDNPM
jgi:hypothetical protein